MFLYAAVSYGATPAVKIDIMGVRLGTPLSQAEAASGGSCEKDSPNVITNGATCKKTRGDETDEFVITATRYLPGQLVTRITFMFCSSENPVKTARESFNLPDLVYRKNSKYGNNKYTILLSFSNSSGICQNENADQYWLEISDNDLIAKEEAAAPTVPTPRPLSGKIVPAPKL
jgi:hypothetical protein